MLDEDQIIEDLLLLNSSIVHDALRTENYINQTLPQDGYLPITNIVSVGVEFTTHLID